MSHATTTTIRLTEAQKRRVACPTCGAPKGRPCKSSRQPGANTFGGGWGGPPSLDRAHDTRRRAALDALTPTPSDPAIAPSTPSPRSLIIGVPSPSSEPVTWYVDGVRYDCRREEGACPFCGARAVVRLPAPLRAIQPDGTTHVCVPTLGGCNHGFEDVLTPVTAQSSSVDIYAEIVRLRASPDTTIEQIQIDHLISVLASRGIAVPEET